MTLAGSIASRTGTGGAYRLSSRVSETDGSGAKAKGAAFGQLLLEYLISTILISL